MDVWQKCLLPNASMLFMDHSDRDLIVRLIHADVSRLCLHKVKAHQDPAQERDPFTRYHLLGNAEADNKLAQWACWNLMPQLVHQLSQLHDDTAKDITLVSDFYKCCLEVQYTRAALQNTQHVGIADNEGAVPSVDVFQKLTDWSVPHSCWVFPQFEESRLQRAVCGKHVIMSLVDWLQSCSWPSDADSDAAHKNLGISWTEIAVAVAVRHNMWLPIKRKQQDNLEHVIQPQTLAECNLLNVTLAEQTANISLMVKNLGSMLMQVFFLLMLLKARSLHYLCMALKQLRAWRWDHSFLSKARLFRFCNPFSSELTICRDYQISALVLFLGGWKMRSYVYNRFENVRDLQICKGVAYVPKMAIRHLFLGSRARATLFANAGGSPFLVNGKGLNSG